MSNSNTNLQTQSSNALHNAIMEAGSKDRPPMLAPGNYVQWKSRIKRYIDTKPNSELIHYCLQNPPYTYQWAEKTVPVAEGSSETTTERYMENYKNVSQDIRDQLNAEAEAVQIILTGIDNDIYSTVDACPNACEMWKAIERLKQGESINVQDLETNLYWEFGKFTSRDGESLESYYSRFYKIMNELVTEIRCHVTNHQVNGPVLTSTTPEWQEQTHQNEVNEIRTGKTSSTANPLCTLTSLIGKPITDMSLLKNGIGSHIYVHGTIQTRFTPDPADNSGLQSLMMSEYISTSESILFMLTLANDQIAPILGYGDLVQGTTTIKRVYYVEGLNHNLFSVSQFYDAGLEVAFWKSTCYIRDLKGNDLLTEHINLLSKNNIVNGLPKLKFVKDHLCSSCELGKAKRKSFHTKTTPSSKRRLQLLHMDLCGPMRVESINGKKYVLVIVDDYSRYTWTHFLRSKDETPRVLIDFLTLVQRGLHAQVTTVRTDKGTKFLNKTLHAYFAKEGIRHETSTEDLLRSQ
ncbi:retrovirus-related pol polyprotein from transposon TNT 1-94 [Tanacetum coccineum]